MTNVAQRSFSGGEVAPSFYARTDLAKYTIALRTCKNFICLRDGGATNRAGTDFVGLTPISAVAWLLPFVFNDDQSYALEFTAGQLRVIQRGAYLAVSVTTPYLASELPALQITQSADVLTIVHSMHPVMELRRVAALTWTLTAATLGPTIGIPQNFAITPPSTGDFSVNPPFVSWVVTAISDSTGEESLASVELGSTSAEFGVAGYPPDFRVLTWDAVAGASNYNIYKSYSGGGFGKVGTSGVPTYFDGGRTPDTEDQPPVGRLLFAAAGDYPSAVANAQQRRILAGSLNEPETFRTSRTGDLNNFTVSVPTQDDDAVTATLISKKVNAIRHLVDADALFVLTSGGEWVLRGDAAGVLRPTDINALNFSKHGSSLLPPIVIDSRVLFVQARQAIVREIRTNEVGPGYVGANLTLLAGHLFKGYTLVAWAYQEEPHSIIWCVRSDGVLLGLTDLEEQKVLAWHRHDTDGLVESVCVVPEGDEDRVYLVVNRDGVRMVERMASRSFSDVRDAVFTDSSLAYDGRNGTTETMTLSGSTSWEDQELVTVTRSSAHFTAGEIDNRIDFTDADGLPLRVRLTEYTSPTVMAGFPDRLIPAELQGAATRVWTRAVDVVTGLDHLEGKSVAVTGDGYVVASPNNPAYETPVIVTGGSITLEQPYGMLRVGLPYISDLETLDIDTPSGGSLKATKMLANGLMASLEQSRGFFAGQSLPTGTDPVENMDELKIRDVSDEFGLIDLKTDTDAVTFPAAWNTNGRVAIRNVDPIPLTVLAVIPRGHIAG